MQKNKSVFFVFFYMLNVPYMCKKINGKNDENNEN